MRSLLALTALLLVDWLAGCGFMTSRPQIHRYQLGPFTAARLKSDRVPIKLGSVTGTAPFRDTGIAYQTAAYRLDTYGFNRWIAPPVELLAQRLNHSLQRASTAPVTRWYSTPPSSRFKRWIAAMKIPDWWKLIFVFAASVRPS
jgi:uncharacterized lipoprotein YmbA